MSEFIKSPAYLYDEPAKYTRFDGGINNDPANENLHSNELRDAVNCDYQSDGNLTRRYGAKQYKELRFNDSNINVHRNIIQGTFNYVGKHNTYFVVVRDGYIYYSTLGESAIFNLIEVPIPVDTSKELYDPLNLIADLDVYDPNGSIVSGPWFGIAIEAEAPSNLANHEGYVLQSEFLLAEDEGAHNYDGPNPYSGIYKPDEPKLILQNYKTVQGAVFSDKLFIATGTRYIYLSEEVVGNEVKIVAQIITPYETNGFDYTNIGLNYLSPFPSQLLTDTYELAVSRINGIFCDAGAVFEDNQSAVTFRAIMDYIEGTTPDDYYFKWETKKNNDAWFEELKLKDGIGRNTKLVDLSGGTELVAGDTVQVRCTYSNDTFKTFETTGVVANVEDANGDWIIDKAFAEFGQYSISFTVLADGLPQYRPTASPIFQQIHSCNKMFADGRMLILYGSTSEEGNWFKTIVGNYEYITLRNSLNFQTNKNERIVACLPLDGNIIVFADNPQLGGSIHKVYGNGDDFDAGNGYFSPFKKKVVNTSVSCDHPNSVQFVRNYIIFKYRSGIYMLDTRELNADRVQVTKISHQISHKNPKVFMPTVEYSDDYEYNLYSEITADYYGIIFPKEKQRWKMYFNMAKQYDDSNLLYFPWLRDEGDILNIDNVVNINNISTHVLDDKLIQYTDNTYNDLGEKFFSHMKLKGYDCYNTALVKFLNSLLIYYFRGATDHLSLDVHVWNEANYKLIGEQFQSFYDEETHTIRYDDPNTYYSENIDPLDKRSLVLDVTPLGDSLLGKDLFTSKVFRPDLKFPCLNVFIDIRIDSSEAFSLSSITMNYTTTEMPVKSLPSIYHAIVRKE